MKSFPRIHCFSWIDARPDVARHAENLHGDPLAAHLKGFFDQRSLSYLAEVVL